jgi:hypothetical protein
MTSIIDLLDLSRRSGLDDIVHPEHRLECLNVRCEHTRLRAQLHKLVVHVEHRRLQSRAPKGLPPERPSEVVVVSQMQSALTAAFKAALFAATWGHLPLR